MIKTTLATLLALFIISATASAQTDSLKDTKPVFTKVDKEAKFPGGMQGWKTYLETNLNANLAKHIKLKRKQKFAQQTVKVQFLVDKDGNVSNVKAVNNAEVHPKLAAEAERVIKEGPKWEPAEQNGRRVLYQCIQYITWQVEEE